MNELKPSYAQRYWSCLPIGLFNLFISIKQASSIICSLDKFKLKAFDKDKIKEIRKDADPPNPDPPEAKPNVFNSIKFGIFK